MASRPTATIVRSISSRPASTNTPTFEIAPGSTRAISVACARPIARCETGQKLRPIASAPASAQARASSAVVTPQIFTRTDTGISADQLAKRRLGIGRGHERLADQERAHAGGLETLEIAFRLEPALGDDERSLRHE